MRIIFAIFAVLAVSNSLAHAKNFKNMEIEIGSLNIDGKFARQVVSVTNKSGRSLRLVTVECAYYAGSSLIASAQGFIQNLDNDEMGSETVLADNAGDADKTKCRIVGAE